MYTPIFVSIRRQINLHCTILIQSPHWVHGVLCLENMVIAETEKQPQHPLLQQWLHVVDMGMAAIQMRKGIVLATNNTLESQ